jgi:hypothetical protein
METKNTNQNRANLTKNRNRWVTHLKAFMSLTLKKYNDKNS